MFLDNENRKGEAYVFEKESIIVLDMNELPFVT